MTDPAARLLRLLAFLQAARPWSGAELAERLGVDARTVRRDIEKLRNLGYLVDSTPGYTGYQLAASAKMPPLLLDDEEVVAVALGLYLAAGGGEESAARALAKLERFVPARLRHRLAVLHNTATIVPAGTAAVSAETINIITTAISERHQLRFDYQTPDGTSYSCVTEPHKLINVGRRWYLVAWETQAEFWHSFRVDLLTPSTLPGPRFTPRHMPSDQQAVLAMTEVDIVPFKIQAPITIAAPITEAARKIPPTVGYLEAVDDTTCVLHIGANSYDEMAVRLGLAGFPFMMHNFEFTIDRLPALIDHLRDLIDRSTTDRSP